MDNLEQKVMLQKVVTGLVIVVMVTYGTFKIVQYSTVCRLCGKVRLFRKVMLGCSSHRQLIYYGNYKFFGYLFSIQQFVFPQLIIVAVTIFGQTSYYCSQWVIF